MNTHIIGIGGVGSWLTYSMVKLIGNGTLILHDGDRLEEKNLDRQLFDSHDIGEYKAEALSRRLGPDFINEYFTQGQATYADEDVLICCADNNPARVAVLEEADRCGCRVIIAANETTSAEAVYYDGDGMHFEAGGELDPRHYYPEWVKDKTGDPRAAKIGCVGAPQLLNRQLVSANFMAASLAQWLYVLWVIEIEHFSVDGKNFFDTASLPYRLRANLSRLETHLIRDAKPKEQNG
jgi:hypothetical protein